MAKLISENSRQSDCFGRWGGEEFMMIIPHSANHQETELFANKLCRLIAEHKFEKLSVDDTNKLLKHLEKNQIVKEGMVLADIYNIDTEVYKTSSKGNKIGF